MWVYCWEGDRLQCTEGGGECKERNRDIQIELLEYEFHWRLFHCGASNRKEEDHGNVGKDREGDSFGAFGIG